MSNTTYKLQIEDLNPSAIESEVPGDQKLREGYIPNDDEDVYEKPTESNVDKVENVGTFVPVYTQTKEETSFEKGDVKLHKITVKENISDEEPTANVATEAVYKTINNSLYSSVHGELVPGPQKLRELVVAEENEEEQKEEHHEEDKKPKTRIPVSRFKQAAVKVKEERRSTKEKTAPEPKLEKQKEAPKAGPRRSSIPKLHHKSASYPPQKPPRFSKEGNTAEPNDKHIKSNKINPEIEIKEDKSTNAQEVGAKKEIVDDKVKSEDEFEKLYEEIVDNNETGAILDNSLLYNKVDDPEKVEHIFEDIIHAYDDDNTPAVLEEKGKSKIPMLKRRSEHEIVVPKQLRRSSLKSPPSVEKGNFKNPFKKEPNEKDNKNATSKQISPKTQEQTKTKEKLLSKIAVIRKLKDQDRNLNSKEKMPEITISKAEDKVNRQQNQKERVMNKPKNLIEETIIIPTFKVQAIKQEENKSQEIQREEKAELQREKEINKEVIQESVANQELSVDAKYHIQDESENNANNGIKDNPVDTKLEAIKNEFKQEDVVDSRPKIDINLQDSKNQESETDIKEDAADKVDHDTGELIIHLDEKKVEYEPIKRINIQEVNYSNSDDASNFKPKYGKIKRETITKLEEVNDETKESENKVIETENIESLQVNNKELSNVNESGRPVNERTVLSDDNILQEDKLTEFKGNSSEETSVTNRDNDITPNNEDNRDIVEEIPVLKGKVSNLINRIDSNNIKDNEKKKEVPSEVVPKKKSVLSKIAMFEKNEPPRPIHRKTPVEFKPKNVEVLKIVDIKETVRNPNIGEEVLQPVQRELDSNNNQNRDEPSNDESVKINENQPKHFLIIEDAVREHVSSMYEIENDSKGGDVSNKENELQANIYKDQNDENQPKHFLIIEDAVREHVSSMYEIENDSKGGDVSNKENELQANIYKDQNDENQPKHFLIIEDAVREHVSSMYEIENDSKGGDVSNKENELQANICKDQNEIINVNKENKAEDITKDKEIEPSYVELRTRDTNETPTFLHKEMKPVKKEIEDLVLKSKETKEEYKPKPRELEDKPRIIDVVLNNSQRPQIRDNSIEATQRDFKAHDNDIDNQKSTNITKDTEFANQHEIKHKENDHSDIDSGVFNINEKSVEVRSTTRRERPKSVAELDLGDAVKGIVHQMIVRMNSQETLIERKEIINIKERPRTKSVSEKIALFERKLAPVKTEDPKYRQTFQKSQLKFEANALSGEQYEKIINDLKNAKLNFGRVADMMYTELRNGYSMPMISAGTALLDRRLIPHIIGAAIELGYRGIDTAYIYGNESEVGEAIRAKIQDGTVTRDELFITSKLWSTFHRPDLVIQACKKSLEVMGLDYFDLYLIHSPMSFKEGRDTLPKIANVVQFSAYHYMDAWYAMEDLVSEGLVRSIGVSNFNSVQVGRVVEKGRIKPVLNQVECHPYLTQRNLDEFCNIRDVTLTCYGVLGSKGTPAHLKSNVPPAIDDPLIQVMAAGLNVTPAQLLIRYHIENGHSVVVKATTAAHLWDNLQALSISLDSGQMEALQALNRNKRIHTFKGMGDTHKDYPFNIAF